MSWDLSNVNAENLDKAKISIKILNDKYNARDNLVNTKKTGMMTNSLVEIKLSEIDSTIKNIKGDLKSMGAKESA